VQKTEWTEAPGLQRAPKESKAPKAPKAPKGTRSKVANFPARAAKRSR
jgi:hypothetical protein